MVYKIELKPNSSFIGRIKSNTLFGAFCYAYNGFVDEETFKKQMEEVVFSDLFYKNGLPKKIVHGEVEYGSTKNGVMKNEVHNLVDRDSKTVKGSEGLYSIQSTFSKSNMIFFMYTSLDKTEIDKVLRVMLLRGLGAKKSTGKGSFDLVSINEIELDYTKEKKVIALSDFIPDEKTSTNIEEVKIVCREGITLDGKIQKPLYLLSVGSVFVKDNNQRETCGKLIYDTNTDTYINAKTIMYPVA